MRRHFLRSSLWQAGGQRPSQAKVRSSGRRTKPTAMSAPLTISIIHLPWFFIAVLTRRQRRRRLFLNIVASEWRLILNNPEKEFAGFCERFDIDEGRISVVGWALRSSNLEPPLVFRLSIAGHSFEFAPTVMRDDVSRMVNSPLPPCGIATSVSLSLSPHEEWATASFQACWADGDKLELPELKDSDPDLRRLINFNSMAEFDRYFQNPAFRRTTPLLQAYGAARAMRIANGDINFWLAGLVVGTYRCLEQGTFQRSEVEAGLARWGVFNIVFVEKGSG